MVLTTAKFTTTSESKTSVTGAVARRRLLSAGIRVPLSLKDDVSIALVNIRIHFDSFFFQIGNVYFLSETNRYQRTIANRNFNWRQMACCLLLSKDYERLRHGHRIRNFFLIFFSVVGFDKKKNSNSIRLILSEYLIY